MFWSYFNSRMSTFRNSSNISYKTLVDLTHSQLLMGLPKFSVTFSVPHANFLHMYQTSDESIINLQNLTATGSYPF